MNKYVYFTCLLISALIFLTLFEVIPFPQLFPDTEETTVDITHFDLHDNASGSHVQGAMFARMSEATRRVVITAHLQISSDDFGGVGFSIPQGWVVTEKLNSYPASDMCNRSEHYISEWHTGDPLVQYNTRVEISPDQKVFGTGSGGQGNVVIALQPEDDEHPSDECRIRVGVGSKMRHGTRVIHPSFEEYAVDFSNYAKNTEIPPVSTDSAKNPTGSSGEPHMIGG